MCESASKAPVCLSSFRSESDCWDRDVCMIFLVMLVLLVMVLVFGLVFCVPSITCYAGT